MTKFNWISSFVYDAATGEQFAAAAILENGRYVACVDGVKSLETFGTFEDAKAYVEAALTGRPVPATATPSELTERLDRDQVAAVEGFQYEPETPIVTPEFMAKAAAADRFTPEVEAAFRFMIDSVSETMGGLDYLVTRSVDELSKADPDTAIIIADDLRAARDLLLKARRNARNVVDAYYSATPEVMFECTECGVDFPSKESDPVCPKCTWRKDVVRV